MLKKYLETNFVGLKVITKDCAKDSWQQAKKAQRERKKKEGDGRFYKQGSNSSSSLSSSDGESLAGREAAAAAEEEGASKRTKIKKASLGLTDPMAQVMQWAEKH
jgi:hypothetical protein